MRTTKFLGSPQQIRAAIKNLLNTQRLDVAVAFVGDDWDEILSGYHGELRLICWLSSTNTNPHSVRTLMTRPSTDVRQRHAMHCKVYVSPTRGAVVGSANLSKAALADNDNSGQDEAAILITQPSTVAEIENWFEVLWNDVDNTLAIDSSDLKAAQASWDKAREARQIAGLGATSRKGRQKAMNTGNQPAPTIPLPALKRESEKEKTGAHILTDEEYQQALACLSPSAMQGLRRNIIDHLRSGSKTKAYLHHLNPGRGNESRDKGDAVQIGVERLNRAFKKKGVPLTIAGTEEFRFLKLRGSYLFSRRDSSLRTKPLTEVHRP
jgi:phospholipase D-like protein